MSQTAQYYRDMLLSLWEKSLYFLSTYTSIYEYILLVFLTSFVSRHADYAIFRQYKLLVSVENQQFNYTTDICFHTYFQRILHFFIIDSILCFFLEL